VSQTFFLLLLLDSLSVGLLCFVKILRPPVGFPRCLLYSVLSVRSLGECFLVLEGMLLLRPTIPWENHFVCVSGRLEDWFASRMIMSVPCLTPLHRF
jgi:hypothetical protein